MTFEIRTLHKQDYDQWLPLWNENCLNQVAQNISDETWRRICDPQEPVHGIAAFDNDKMLGILHYIIHPTTGSIEPVAYMQDVFVDKTHRRQGIARKLVEHLFAHSKEQNWARIYWLASADNQQAQSLYKNLGIKLDFTLHIYMPGLSG